MATLREMPSKPHEREGKVGTGLPGSVAARGAAPAAAGVVLGKLSHARWGACWAVCAMVSSFASCLGSVRNTPASFRLTAASLAGPSSPVKTGGQHIELLLFKLSQHTLHSCLQVKV